MRSGFKADFGPVTGVRGGGGDPLELALLQPIQTPFCVDDAHCRKPVPPPSPKDAVKTQEAPPPLLPSLQLGWPGGAQSCTARTPAYEGQGLLGVSVTWQAGTALPELSELSELSEDVLLSPREKQKLFF